MTKQEKDINQLKKNIQFALDNFDKYSDLYTKRTNYLMGVSISCRKGEMQFHYGHDPVAEDHDRVQKERKHVVGGKEVMKSTTNNLKKDKNKKQKK